jgi:hypothetical protein
MQQSGQKSAASSSSIDEQWLEQASTNNFPFRASANFKLTNRTTN